MYLSDIESDSGRVAKPAAWFRRHKISYLALPVLGLGLFALVQGVSGTTEAVPPPLSVITVSKPLTRMITDWDDYVGRFEASQNVDVRPRVSGQLVGIHFKDGDIVRKGQLLFTIDPRPFAAQVAEMQAQVASAATALDLARSELDRASRLIHDQAVSDAEIDLLKARVRSAQAQLAASQAQVRSRALNLEFTRITAPVTGRISDRRVDVGNQVIGDNGTGATLLTSINAMDPIYFAFDGSEALYLKQKRHLAQQGQGGAGQRVEIRLQDEPNYQWRGQVDFTNHAIENGSGTIRGRAVIANPDHFLVPGMFGNMRMRVGAAHSALLVPDGAVATDQSRKLVYVVGKDDVVAARPVQVGALVDGLRVIRSGLSPHERVVISGIQYAQPGGKVHSVPGRIEAVKTVTPPTPNSQQSGQATLATP